MNTWNTLLETNQQRVDNNTLTTVKHQIQQVDNPTPAMVISVDTVRVDNAILLNYLTSELALDESEIWSTDQNIPIDNHCSDDEFLFGMPRGSGDYEHEGDESKVHNAIPTSR